MTTDDLSYHLALLKHLRTILDAVEDAEPFTDTGHQQFLERFDEMQQQIAHAPQERYLGQEILGQVFQRYPQIAHLVPRDLLWFFGGECLHFMPDEEINLYQQLEDQRFSAETQGLAFDWNDAKQQLMQSLQMNTQKAP